MTSVTGAQPHVAADVARGPEFTFPARLRMAAAVIGRSFAASRAYERAQGTSARRAALQDFAGVR